MGGRFLGFGMAAALASAGAAGGEPRALDERGALGARLDWKLRYAHFEYLESHDVSEEKRLDEARLEIGLTAPAGSQVFVADTEGRIRHGAEEGKADVDLRELYFEMRSASGPGWTGLEDASLRVGQQMFSWGSGVLFNPTDNLSPWDASDPFEPRRRGIPAVKAAVGRGLHVMEVIYLTTFEASELPELGDRFFIYSPRTTPNPSYPAGPAAWRVNYAGVDKSEKPSRGRDSGQYAARYLGSVGGWDVALSYFKGYENIALMEATPTRVDPATGTADVLVRYIYPEQQVWGADVSGFLGRLGVHLEAAYFDMEKTGHQIGVGDQDYASVIGGIEYPFHDVIGTQDFSVSLEYAREFKEEEDDRVYINRIYPNSVLCRVTHAIDYRWSGEARFVYDFETEGSYGRLSYDYQYSDHGRFTLGVEMFGGPKGCFFGEYDKNDRVFAKYAVLF